MAESALGIDGGMTSDMDVIRESFAAPERFGVVFERHFSRIFRYLSLRAGPSAAEDLTAQTFAVAFERRASVEGKGGSALPWLYGIASNLLRNEQRREQHRLSVAIGITAQEPWSSLGDPVLESEAGYLLDAVEKLDDDQREALLLFVWADLSYFEIAEALSIPVGTVASRISRARNGLRSILNGGSRSGTESGEMMNDLAQLREIGDRWSLPTEDAQDRCRERLSALIQAELHRSIDPSAGDVVVLESRAADARERRRTSLARSPQRAVALTLVAAALVAGLVSAVVIGLGGGNRTAAAAELDKLAAVAAAQAPVDQLSPGQYLYFQMTNSKIVTVALGTGSVYSLVVPETRATWIATDGAGRIDVTDGTPTFLTPHDRATWEKAGSLSLAQYSYASHETYAAGGLGGPKLTRASTDPATLANQIAGRELEGGPAGAGETFVQIGDFLRQSDASPALRSALYQVAATLPGIELLGNVVDQGGGHGVGIAYVSNGVQTEYVIDPQTSQMIGETKTAVSATNVYGAPAGTVVAWSNYEVPGAVVEAVGATS